MRLIQLATFAAVALVGTAACSRQPEPSVGGRPPPIVVPKSWDEASKAFEGEPVQPSRPSGPPMGITSDEEVPAGTTFRVGLREPLSTETARPGQTFTAKLRDPLVATDDEVAADTGAMVTGHVVAVRSGVHPRLALAFDTVETIGGPVSLDVRGSDALGGRFTLAGIDAAEQAGAEVVLAPKAEMAKDRHSPRVGRIRQTDIDVAPDDDIELVTKVPLPLRGVPVTTAPLPLP